MFRLIALFLLAATLAPTQSALAAGEVCRVIAIEPILGSSRQGDPELWIDCGDDPDQQQMDMMEELSTVSNASTALSYMISLGYTLRGQSEHDSYGGRRGITHYTMVR